MEIQSPRGTKDWFGEEILVRRKIENILREIAKLYNVGEIDTPIFEHTELFIRGVGDTTDIVQKEMYTFTDKGDRSITLKPEGTAGAVRAFAEQKLFANAQPTKLFYITPCFRYEKPQSGRLRQFHQFGVEIFGTGEATADAEVISMLVQTFKELGLRGITLHINSIGCPNCRADYNNALIEYLSSNKEKLCPTCIARLEKNPMRVIDCKNPNCKAIVKDAPRTIEYLDKECKKHFEDLKNILNSLEIKFEIDKDIVRGLDYYTKTVFEFIDSKGATICGGGRYDRLLKEVTEVDMPAVGFGVGIERLILAMTEENALPELENQLDLFIGYIGESGRLETQKLANFLRSNRVKVEVEHLGRSVKAQMKFANKTGAKYVTIIGDNEIETDKCTVKNMETGEEIEMCMEQLMDLK